MLVDKLGPYTFYHISANVVPKFTKISLNFFEKAAGWNFVALWYRIEARLACIAK